MNGQFINGDCMDYLPHYEDNHFDLAIVDPPYGIEINNRGNVNHNFGKKIEGGWTVQKVKYKMGNWDNNKPDESYFVELKRVSKNQIIWGANHFPYSFRGGLVWDKNIGENFSMSQVEIASNTIINTMRLYKYMWCGMLQGHNGNAREIRLHPTQKPVALYKWLLKNYAKEGDLILDTHVGSASSLIACEDMGFEYVGYELDKDYCQAATKRLNNHIAQLKIF